MKWSIFLFFLIFYSSCYQKKDDYIEASGVHPAAIHLYLNPSDTGSSLLQTIQRVDTLASLNVFDISLLNNISYRISEYKGISIRTYNPDTTIYIKVIGAIHARKIGANSFIVESTIGEARFNVDNYAFTPVYFKFKYPGYPPPITDNIKMGLRVYTSNQYNSQTYSTKYYFQCPDESNKIIFGWEVGTLTNPKCFAYED